MMKKEETISKIEGILKEWTITDMLGFRHKLATHLYSQGLRFVKSSPHATYALRRFMK